MNESQWEVTYKNVCICHAQRQYQNYTAFKTVTDNVSFPMSVPISLKESCILPTHLQGWL